MHSVVAISPLVFFLAMVRNVEGRPFRPPPHLGPRVNYTEMKRLQVCVTCRKTDVFQCALVHRSDIPTSDASFRERSVRVRTMSETLGRSLSKNCPK